LKAEFRDSETKREKKAELSSNMADFKKRLILVCNNFVNLKEIVKKEKFQKVSGILLDLGMSSWHLEKSGKGFSFLRNEPLDMRYSPENPLTPLEVNGARRKHKENKPLTGLTAEKILNYWSLQEIERILKEYGEERFSQEIAKNIINFRKLRPIKITSQLVEIIKESIPQRFQHKRIHPATKTFQALRIAVNDELNNLEKVLLQSLDYNPPTTSSHFSLRSEWAPILKPGGRLVIISFHSLEDRIVKNFFRDRASIYRSEGEEEDKVLFANQTLNILTKKPITPSIKEIKINPRSRSAKLRAAQLN